LIAGMGNAVRALSWRCWPPRCFTCYFLAGKEIVCSVRTMHEGSKANAFGPRHHAFSGCEWFG
jgi:hypothetical protein